MGSTLFCAPIIRENQLITPLVAARTRLRPEVAIEVSLSSFTTNHQLNAQSVGAYPPL
jgi:hypothetical protein